MSTEKDFRILEDYVLPPKAPPQTEDFFRYVKPSQEELDAKLEYDMDEEDFAWLELFNDQRSKSGLSPVSFDAFEALMDRFEKECFFHCTSKNFKPIPPELEHLSDCAICLEGTSREENMILFCDMCCLSVHQKCYGVIRVPEEIWLCKRCLHSPAAVANCCLCSCKSGALKRTLDHKWAHVVCTFWIPEASFGNDRAREPIMGVDGIPSFRWKLTCFVCNQKGKGACLQCQHSNCSTAYHATCAQLVGLSMKMEMYTDADGVTKKKVTTFCDVHSSPTEESSSDIREFSGPKYPSSSSEDEGDDEGMKEKSGNPANVAGVQDMNKLKKLTSWKSRLKKARKVLAAWMDMEQPIFVPVVTVATINKITRRARELEVEKYEAFVTRLHSYWTLKRQSRDGYPLLSSRKFGENIRILNVNLHLSSGSSNQQQHKPSTAHDVNTSVPSTTNSSPSEPPVPARSVDMETASKGSDVFSNEKRSASKHEDEEMLGSDDDDVEEEEEEEEDDDDACDESPHLRDCQRLRQDLEKVRLLIELVKKREKMKMEQVRLRERQIMLEIFPNYNKFKQILDELKGFVVGTSHKYEDGGKYFDVVQSKLDQFSYDTLEEFAADLKFFCGSSNNSMNREVFEKTNAFIEQVIKSCSIVSLSSSPSSSDTSHVFPKPMFIPMSDVKSKHECSALNVVSPQSVDDVGSSKGRARKRKSTNVVKSAGAGGFQYHHHHHHGSSIEVAKDKLLMEPVVSLTSMTSTARVPTSNRGRPRKQKQSPSKSKQEENLSFVRPDEEAIIIPRERESFKTYRMISSPKSDDFEVDRRDVSDVVKAKKSKTSSSSEDENQNKNNNNNNVEEESSDDDDDDEGPSHEFKPFDLVWAKCHNTPWYPAMVISPDVPPPLSLRIQLPVVPQQTVDILSEKPQLKLVLFFDGKFTWKCIPINKLLPLGTNPAIDKGKLLDSKKMNIRKIIQAAYDRALQYQQAEPHVFGARVQQPQQNASELMKHDLLLHHHHHHLQHSFSGSQQQYQLELQQLQQQLRQQIIRESTPSESSSPPPSKSFTQSNRSTSPKASSPANRSATIASSSSSSSSKVGVSQNEVQSNNAADEQRRGTEQKHVEMSNKVTHKKTRD